MIDVDHSLLLEEYNGREYAGENVLHIAIIKKRVDLVEKLVKMEPKLLHSRATGNFFKVSFYIARNNCYSNLFSSIVWRGLLLWRVSSRICNRNKPVRHI